MIDVTVQVAELRHQSILKIPTALLTVDEMDLSVGNLCKILSSANTSNEITSPCH
jgi:hypothetical protein